MDFYNSRYFVINKNLMRFMGIWPYQSFKAKFFIRSCYILFIAGSLVPQFYNIYVNSKIDIDKVIIAGATTLYLIGVSLKLITTIFIENKMKLVYDSIVQNWKMIDNKEEINVLSHESEVGRFLTIGYVSYMNLALILFVSMPLLPTIFDTLMPLNESRPFIYILDGEYGVDKVESYWHIYVFESFVCIWSVIIVVTTDTTYAACVQQCTGLMAIVKLRLQMATTNENNLDVHSGKRSDQSYDLLVHAIDMHKKVLMFANILETSYSKYFLIVITANMGAVSLGSVVILMCLNRPMDLIRYLLIFIGFMIHMFFLSWPGQQLVNSSEDLFQDAYNCNWYNCSKKSQKLLQFMMLRCKDPCQLTAGGIYILNIANFGSLAKTSLSYMTVFASFR